jgi:hypothetical protein
MSRTSRAHSPVSETHWEPAPIRGLVWAALAAAWPYVTQHDNTAGQQTRTRTQAAHLRVSLVIQVKRTALRAVLNPAPGRATPAGRRRARTPRATRLTRAFPLRYEPDRRTDWAMRSGPGGEPSAARDPAPNQVTAASPGSTIAAVEVEGDGEVDHGYQSPFVEINERVDAHVSLDVREAGTVQGPSLLRSPKGTRGRMLSSPQ